MAAKKNPTVQEHLDATDAVQQQLKSADALVVKLSSALAQHRSVLETLEPAQHPLISVKNYQINDGKETPAPDCIRRQIKAINSLLGDRA